MATPTEPQPGPAAHTTNILIFGATGLVGAHIARSILAAKASGKFSRIGIFTSPNTLQTKAQEIEALKSAGAEILAGDVQSSEDVYGALKGFDTVVSCLGRPVIHLQTVVLEAVERHPDVKRFFPSEYGTDIEYGPASKDEKPHQQKIKIRAALAATKNLDYTYVVTGPFGDAEDSLYLAAVPASNEEIGTYDIARRRAVLIDQGRTPISVTTMRDVGKFVVAALLHPENVKNMALRVNSFTATPLEIVAEFERQTGAAQGSWEVGFTSLEEMRRLEREGWEKGDPRAGPITLRRIWGEGGTLYQRRDNWRVGLEEGIDDLRSAVAQAVEVQKRRMSE